MARINDPQQVLLRHIVSTSSIDVTRFSDRLAGQRRKEVTTVYRDMKPIIVKRPSEGSGLIAFPCNAPGCKMPKVPIRVYSVSATKRMRLGDAVKGLLCIVGAIGLVALSDVLGAFQGRGTVLSILVFCAGVSCLAFSLVFWLVCFGQRGIDLVHKPQIDHELKFLP